MPDVLPVSVDVARIAQSYEALERLALAKMDDAEKVQWFQQRAISAEEANRQLNLQNAASAILVKYPKADADDLVGAKSIAEMEQFASRAHAKAEKIETRVKESTTTDIDALIAEALKGKDEELAGIRKVLGRPRQAQAADVDVATTQAQAEVGIGAPAEEKIELGTMDAVFKTAQRIAGKAAGALGLVEE